MPNQFPSRGEVEKQIHADMLRGDVRLIFTDHARERMEERGIIDDDVTRVLMRGHINDAPAPARRRDRYTCKICGITPNWSRAICVVFEPDFQGATVKIITVMWEDWR